MPLLAPARSLNGGPKHPRVRERDLDTERQKHREGASGGGPGELGVLGLWSGPEMFTGAGLLELPLLFLGSPLTSLAALPPKETGRPGGSSFLARQLVT